MSVILASANDLTGIQRWPGGKGLLSVTASNFDGGSAQLRYRDPNTMLNVVNYGAAITADGTAIVELPAGEVDLAFSGGTSADLEAALISIYGS